MERLFSHLPSTVWAWVGMFLVGGAYLLVLAGIDALPIKISVREMAGQLIGCLFVIAALLLPSVVGTMLLMPLRQGRRYRSQRQHRQALAAYKRQLHLLDHFPWLEGLAGLVLADHGPYSVREIIWLHSAETHLDLGQPERAMNALWHCLGINPINADALALLDQIRATATEHRIIGW
jgi:hypothetical protein